MEHKRQYVVAKQLQEEEALRGAVAKEVAATVCSVITVTRTCTKQQWQTTIGRTGPLENRALLPCDILVEVGTYLL